MFDLYLCHVYSPPFFVLLRVSLTGHLAVNSTCELRKLTTNCRVRIFIFHTFIIVPVFTFLVNYFMYLILCICAVPYNWPFSCCVKMLITKNELHWNTALSCFLFFCCLTCKAGVFVETELNRISSTNNTFSKEMFFLVS